MANNELQVILDNKNVPAENAKQLLAAYGAPFIEAGKILKDYKKIVVTDENQTDIMAQARSKRLTLRKTRIEVENKRKELKADYLTVTNAIDSVARYIKGEIEPAEEYLELQEKYGELKQAERAAALKADRTAKLMQYTDSISIYNIDEMDAAEFDALLADLKAKAQAEIDRQKAAALEAEKLAAEKLAEEKRVREENAKLKADAEAAEAARIAERKAEADKQAAIDAEREQERQAAAKKQAEIEAAAAKELAAEKAKADAERQKREDLEKAAADEKAAAEAAQAKAKADADATAMAELLAPDKQKLLNFAAAMETVRKEKLPAVKTSQAQKVVTLIDEMLVKMQTIINEKAKEL